MSFSQHTGPEEFQGMSGPGENGSGLVPRVLEGQRSRVSMADR